MIYTLLTRLASQIDTVLSQISSLVSGPFGS
jgi:hypothetical protein